MEVIAILRKSSRIWESGRISLYPYNINVHVFMLPSEDALADVINQVIKVVGQADEPVLIVCDSQVVFKLLPKGYIRSYLLPATPSSAPSIIRFLESIISWLYRRGRAPTVFVDGCPELLNFLKEMEFPFADLNFADFVICREYKKGYPSTDIIVLPFPETEENLVKFLTKVFYNYIPADVVKEKFEAEEEISKRIWQKILERRRKKK